MRITHDKVGSRADGQGRTVVVDEFVMLDYDAEGRLRGIEVLGASKRLTAATLVLAD